MSAAVSGAPPVRGGRWPTGGAGAGGGRPAHPSDRPARRAAARLAGCWAVLAAGGHLAPAVGAEVALLAALLAAGALASWRAPRMDGARRPSAAALALGALAGALTFPAWAGFTAATGLALGLAPAPAGATYGVAGALAVVLAGPFFEEHLYRGRVLDALRGPCPSRARDAGAVLASSALFALPHLGPWAVLGCLPVGVALAATRLATGSLGLCVALHAGLNAAAQAERAAGPGLALAGAGAWLAAGVLARRRPLAGSGGVRARGV